MEPLIFKQLARWSGVPWVADLDVPQIGLLVVAGLVTVLLSVRLLRRAELPLWRHGAGAIVAACVGGAFGGHWVWMAFSSVDVWANPTLLVLVFEGGFSSLGVYAGAAAGMALYMTLTHQPFWRYADAFAPGLLVGAGVARLGCLLQGCDFGHVAPGLPWALRYPRGSRAFAWLENLGLVSEYQRVGLPMHPFPLYEAIPALLLGTAVWARPDLLGRDTGQRAAGCAALYCVARCIAEHFRADTPMVWGGFTALQVLCVVGAALFGWLWWRCAEVRGASPIFVEQQG